ncbi:MAG: glycosyltransferase, partial [Candidatus Methylomirabilis sp.]|nr:glycosyltransferase [Deltaproteobacteria bacterium]
SLVRSDLNVRLIFVGSFDLPSTEAATRATPGWDRVDFRGFQGRREVAAALAEARAGLTLFLPLPNHVAAQPNKLFEYMAAGLPLIASDFPLWRAIVAGANCGLLVEPLDPRAIAAAIEQILEHPDDADKMGRRGREAVYARYNWNVEAEKLLRFYEACLC